MPEYFRIKIFMAAYGSGSYTEAADSLGITQPAVSQNIAELEKQLGVSLFVRSGKGVRMQPTPAAEIFHKFARRVMQDYSDIETAFSPDVAACKKVTVRACKAAIEQILPEVMAALRTLYPHLEVELSPDAPTPDIIISETKSCRDGVLILRFDVAGDNHPLTPVVRFLLNSALSNPRN